MWQCHVGQLINVNWVTQYIQLQSLHPIAHSCSFTLTFHSTQILPHLRLPFSHIHTQYNVLFHPFMLNLLFAYPIYLINTNVSPTTNPYYTKFEGYPIHTTTVTTFHCAFLFIHPDVSFQHRHCHTFASTFHTFTPSNVLFHLFMLNLLFAYPI